MNERQKKPLKTLKEKEQRAKPVVLKTLTKTSWYSLALNIWSNFVLKMATGVLAAVMIASALLFFVLLPRQLIRRARPDSV